MSTYPKRSYGNDYDYGSVNKFDFYSGSQITVWFGNILLDDINSIEWARTQNKRPIYGYASQQMDDVANGTVLIQGNFTINFRQKGYLPAIMEEIKGIYEHFVGEKSSEEKARFDQEGWPEVRNIIGLHLKNGTFGPTTSAQIKELGESQDFMELAKIYEDTIWGDLSLIDKKGQKMNSAADVVQSRFIPDGFNILITYGNTSNSEARTMSEKLQSTTKSLNGVHIVGETQSIQVGGQPIQEQYNFIARGTDEFVGTRV